MTLGGTTGLYRINLTTGAATALGTISVGGQPISGLTLGDSPSNLFTSAADSVTLPYGGVPWYAGSGADVVNGTSLNDNIYGEGDNDTIASLDGADRVDGGSGDDLIYGSAGADTLIGGIGSDEFAYFLPGDISGDVIDGGSDGTVGDAISVNFGGFADFTSASFSSVGNTSIEALLLFGGSFHNVSFNASQFGPSRISTALEILGDSGIDVVAISNVSGAFSAANFRFVDWTTAKIYCPSSAVQQATA